jgi:hypothetical protein
MKRMKKWSFVAFLAAVFITVLLFPIMAGALMSTLEDAVDNPVQTDGTTALTFTPG